LRPLERGALLLEPTQRLLPRQAFPLECGPGLSEGSPLLLKLSFRLLARGLLLQSCSSAAASAAALSARVVLSASASLALSSA
jgi:hypothetical protein